MYKISFFPGYDVEFSNYEIGAIIDGLIYFKHFKTDSYLSAPDTYSKVDDLIDKLQFVSSYEITKRSDNVTCD